MGQLYSVYMMPACININDHFAAAAAAATATTAAVAAAAAAVATLEDETATN
jgi:hypothetical protein